MSLRAAFLGMTILVLAGCGHVILGFRLRAADGGDLPIRPARSPRFWGIHLGQGPIGDPWTKPWKDHHFLSLEEGTPYAFVIDLLSNAGTPLFRIYYQDSATPEGEGVPKLVQEDVEPYDLAVLVMASY